MAATGKTPILLYGSTTATNQPSAGNLTNSSDGCEIAINVADKNLFFKDTTNAVNTVPIRQSSASSNGWLSSTDWSTFNSKAPATGSSSITTVGTITSGTWNGTTVDVSHGGTGLTTLATGWIPYGNGTGAFSATSNFLIDASGNLRLNNAATISGTNNSYNFNCSNDISTGSFLIGVNGSFLGRQSSDGSTILNTGQANLIFSRGIYGSTSDTMRLFNSGGVSIGNTTDPGAGNLRFNTTGTNGIYFGSSSKLADYEEGTWTPNQGAGLTVVGSFSSSGTYTKVGRIVTVQGTLTGSTSIAVSAGTYLTTNLPYVASTFGCGGMENGTLTANSGVLATSGLIYATGALTASSNIYFSVTYTI